MTNRVRRILELDAEESGPLTDYLADGGQGRRDLPPVPNEHGYIVVDDPLGGSLLDEHPGDGWPPVQPRR